jgi:hypothetical protein
MPREGGTGPLKTGGFDSPGPWRARELRAAGGGNRERERVRFTLLVTVCRDPGLPG